MKLHFDAQQAYQLDAIRAVVDLFAGQPVASGSFEWQANLLEPELLDTLGVANGLALTDARLFANLGAVQQHNDLKPAEALATDEILGARNFSVEMETGTGKTYVYLRTIHELHRAYLQRETELTRTTLVDILIDSGRIAQALKNPQQFMEQAASAIQHAKRELMVDGIRYERIDGQSYEMQLFENDEIESYLSRLLAVDSSIYDAVEYDSEVERKFAAALDANEDIRLFVKLPRWFVVKTPLGDYRPDWAIVRERDGKVYLVVETKGTTDLKTLPGSEGLRIKCGKRHFEECLKVPYKLATTLKDLD